MSNNPYDPAAQGENAQNSQDAQPTEVYAPLDDQPTAVYPRYEAPPAYEQAPPAYEPPPAYEQVPREPAPYASQQAQPPTSAAYAAPTGDGRPRTFGRFSLGLAIAGTVLSIGGFLPLPGVGLALAAAGGLLLLTALVLGIVALANRRQGGKGLGIAGIIVSIIGGGVFIAALFVSFIVLGLSASSDSEPVVDETIEVEEEVAPPEEEPSAFDEQAFLNEVRPQLDALFREIAPDAPAELTESYPDGLLITMGQGLLLGGDVARDALATTLTQASGDLMTEEQANRFVDIIYWAAQSHLAE